MLGRLQLTCLLGAKPHGPPLKTTLAEGRQGFSLKGQWNKPDFLYCNDTHHCLLSEIRMTIRPACEKMLRSLVSIILLSSIMQDNLISITALIDESPSPGAARKENLYPCETFFGAPTQVFFFFWSTKFFFRFGDSLSGAPCVRTCRTA